MDTLMHQQHRLTPEQLRAGEPAHLHCKRCGADLEVALPPLAEVIADRHFAVTSGVAERQRLTLREIEIFDVLAAATGEVVTYEALTLAFVSYFDKGSVHLVRQQMLRLRRKLAGSRWRAETVKGVGYRLVRLEGED